MSLQGIDKIVNGEQVSNLVSARQNLGNLLGKDVKTLKGSSAKIEAEVRSLQSAIVDVSQQIDGHVRTSLLKEGDTEKLVALNEELTKSCDAMSRLGEKNIQILPKRAYFRRVWAWITGKTVIVQTPVDIQREKERVDKSVVEAFQKAFYSPEKQLVKRAGTLKKGLEQVARSLQNPLHAPRVELITAHKFGRVFKSPALKLQVIEEKEYSTIVEVGMMKKGSTKASDVFDQVQRVTITPQGLKREGEERVLKSWTEIHQELKREEE